MHKFNQFLPQSKHQLAWKLKWLYGSPDLLDLWVGIISEKTYHGGLFGVLGTVMTAHAFRSIRDGDRFWYERAYPPEVVETIKATTLEDVISRNIHEPLLTHNLFVAGS